MRCGEIVNEINNMNAHERRETRQKIWRVTPKSPVRKFSILNTPSLTHNNKEDWFLERQKAILERNLQENRIF